MVGKNFLERWILLHEQRLHCRIDAVQILARRLIGSREAGAAKHDQHRNRSRGVGRRHQRHVNLHIDGRIRRVVDLPDEVLRDDAAEADHLVVNRRHVPRHLRHIFRNAAVNILLVPFDDLRPALAPPHLRCSYLLAVVQGERVGKIGIRIGLRLIVVGVVGRLLIAARPRAQRLDA
jgi:hypothetical protein